MRLRNTPEAYGEIAKWLHWIIALLFLAAYCAVYYRHWFTEKNTPGNWNALQLHLSFGVTIGVFVFLRVLWKLTNPGPRLEPGTRWEHLAAKAGHAALYFFMIAMPVTGYLGTGADTHYFFTYHIPKFENTALYEWLVTGLLGMSFEQFEEPIDFFHKDIGGALLVWILIAIHVAAALYHHFVKRDRTLKRMLPRLR
ncbi:MAG TPA: cytochrome b [Gammaproteobacteria bacterium]